MRAIMGVFAATLIGAAVLGTGMIAEPAQASGTRAQHGPKVCFVNNSGEKYYIKAVYPSGSTGGTKLGNKGKYCSTNPAPVAVRVSKERKSPVLCTAQVSSGRTYELTSVGSGGVCGWKSTAN